MADNINATAVNEDELFTFVSNDTIESEKIIAPRYSYWRSVFRVFFRKKANWVALAMLALLLFCCFVIPVFCKYDPYENVTNADMFNRNPISAMKFTGGFSLKWCLGSGKLGNSIFYGIWSSARTSLLLAIIVTAINMTIGIIMGAVWGYSKSMDKVMIVIYSIIANVPYILLISVLVYIMKSSGFWPFVFALTVTGWLGIAYFFRTQVMIIRDREYSLASRCLGTPIPRIISKNIMPFLTSVIVTLLATELPAIISWEVYLSFIGIGLSANVPSLGRMIQEAQDSFLTFPWEFWPPVAIAALLTIILYVLGQNLADATDPRTHM